MLNSQVNFNGCVRGNVSVNLDNKNSSFTYNRNDNSEGKFEPGSVIVSKENPNEALLILSKSGGDCPCCDMDPEPYEIRTLPIDLSRLRTYSEDIKYYQGYSKAGQLNVRVSD